MVLRYCLKEHVDNVPIVRKRLRKTPARVWRNSQMLVSSAFSISIYVQIWPPQTSDFLVGGLPQEVSQTVKYPDAF